VNSPLLESLADVQHAIWAHWMEYLFSRCERNPDGSATIPATLVERWQRQVSTVYTDLTERERDSDRQQAAKVLTVLAEYPDADPAAVLATLPPALSDYIRIWFTTRR